MNVGSSGAGWDARLEQLRRQYPRWSIWHGTITDEYWAMPPRDHPTQQDLISARDADELARRLVRADQRHDL